MSPEQSVLQAVFGYEQFRGPQQAIVSHVIAGGDALVLMPTGGGKSLCYQVPAIVRQQQGLGVTLVSMPHAVLYMDSGALVRVLPDWYVDGGMLSLYFTAARLLPAKTRVFVDFIVERFRAQRLAERFSALV